ncbi:DUF3035 domain-containing protein [Wenxinia saemankumensis]|uniref:Beta-barrel assembly machine subunit BamF n=1 Tax=Wenxinia saemankumensis TaxID=1447782 RepID=A0A1M6EBX3_9RHOB|nr:DUF3035 domain-containing protein [Wenxinia saemankumensis]SHI82982.1 Beta-barrel assembly machine subunit BamF [Wenxinia saemankumensis]
MTGGEDETGDGMRRTGRAIGAALALGALTACAGGTDGLRVLESPSAGPDEFSVVPQRPLQMPPGTALPPPDPAAGNRADPAPLVEAQIVLGGDPQAAGGGIPARDAALLAATGGADPAIRRSLAQEDAAFRSRAAAFALFGGDRYYQAYAGQALDAYAELERFRAAGIAVPSAPPRE